MENQAVNDPFPLELPLEFPPENDLTQDTFSGLEFGELPADPFSPSSDSSLSLVDDLNLDDQPLVLTNGVPSAPQANAAQRNAKPRRKGRPRSDPAERELTQEEKRERNKQSAAKYRQKRKNYIGELEGQVKDLGHTLHDQTQTITALQTENKVLKDQLSYLKSLVDTLGLGGMLQFDLPKVGTTMAVFSVLSVLLVLFSSPLPAMGRTDGRFNRYLLQTNNDSNSPLLEKDVESSLLCNATESECNLLRDTTATLVSVPPISSIIGVIIAFLIVARMEMQAGTALQPVR